MAYGHQIDQVAILGTGGAETFLASAAAGVRGRLVNNSPHGYILRAVSFHMNASSAGTAKPVMSIRKADGPATSTATGTEIATITFPASRAKGWVITRANLQSAFTPGDHLILFTKTAATKALTARCRVHL